MSTTVLSQAATRRLARQGYSGLSARLVIVQSALCHPDWSAETHVGYLESEEGIRGVTEADVLAALRAEGLS